MSEELPFHQVMRASTVEAHDRANASPYMAALFEGALTVADYARLVEQYAFVYSALEATGDGLAEDGVAGDFVVDELRRGPAIAEDLRFYGVPEPRALPATERYAQRIRESADWPGGFVAHHYTRYLGDLAGGQAVRVLLERTYGVQGGGAAFYDFSALGPTPVFRRRYRALLDAAPWDAAEKERIVAEVREAFELNIAMLADLADVTDAVVPRSA